LKTLRKVDIKFTFSLEDLSINVLPDVTVTMGCIRYVWMDFVLVQMSYKSLY